MHPVNWGRGGTPIAEHVNKNGSAGDDEASQSGRKMRSMARVLIFAHKQIPARNVMILLSRL